MNSYIYSYIFIGSALVTFFLALIAISNKKNSANKSLSLLLTAVSIWSLFYGFEISSNTYESLYKYLIVQYIGICTIPVFWIFFASIYTGNDSWIKPKNILLIFIIPVSTFTLVVSNSFHHLFYNSSIIIKTGDLYYHQFETGVFYWVHILYSYTLVLIGVLMVIANLIRVSKDNRSRVLLILFGSLIPYIFSFLYIMGIHPEGNIDLTPIGFLVMGILITVGTFNNGLLDIKPLVLNSLFESIPDAFIVVDSNGEITSTNPKAVEMIRTGELDSVQIKKIIYSDKFISNTNDEVSYIEIESFEKTFRVEKNSITNSKKRKIGTMFLIIDITQEKKYRDALSQSEEQYRQLFENAQEGIVVIQEMRLVFFNPMLLKMTGYSSDELMNMQYTNLIHIDDLAIIEETYTRIASLQETVQKLHFRLIGKNGDICWVEFSSVIIKWNGKQAGLLFVNNIIEQKQAEQLKELLINISNTYINAPVNNFDNTINNSLREMGEFVNADRSYIFDYNWEDNVCNNTFEWCADGISAEIENLQEIPLEYLPFWVETHKKNQPMFVDDVFALEPKSGLREILESQGIKSLITIPMMDNDNCIGFVGFDSVLSLHKYSDKEKQLLQVFSQMIVNLVNRKKANNLLENQLKVQELLNQISSELVSVDNQNIDLKIKKMLQETGQFFNVDRSYILRYSNKTIETNTHEWCATEIGSQKDSIINIDINIFPWWKKQVEKKEIIYIKDAHNLPEEAEIEKAEFARQGIRTLLCFPIINNNNLMGYFGFDSVNDVRKWTKAQIEVIETISNILGDALIKVETEIELIRSKELAEAASIAKSNFLSNMSHEIRTPLNGVIGFTELLRNTNLNKTQKDYLENAISSANSLLGVISDILDFSKIESGKMELESIKTDIIQLFENASDIIKIIASNKDLELLLNIHPDIPRFAYIDPIRTKQVLINLLSNAVKFTHTGEIELSLSFELRNNHSGIYKVKVRDTGIGIKDADRNKLFKAFSQADTSTTRRYGGTGLGLIISNSLVKQMGGTIEFESEYGVGTTFSFDINCQFECGEVPDYSNIKNIKNVLVVDDNAINRLILEETFNYWKIEFNGIDNGLDAIELVKSGNKYDLIIVDYHMPEIDGLETIRLMRNALSKTNINQPIIMLHSSSDDIILHEKAKELNVKFLLTKPVKQDELYYYLNSIYGSDNSNLVASFSKVSINEDSNLQIREKEFCILVAEDTQMNMLVIGNMLRTILPNVTMIEAHNGIEAIREIKLSKPDLILMDVQMPELDGLEATRQIRKLKNGLTIPVIALTAGVSKEEREQCFKSGMDDFLAKPIEKSELKRIIRKYLEKNILEEVKEEPIISNQIHIDKAKLLSKIGNEEVLHSLLVMSKTEYPKYIQEINEAIISTDSQQIKLKAHKLKGSAFNMEFVALGEIALKIEQNIEDKNNLLKYFDLLNKEWELLENEL
ncbi:MAG: histidine kinase N-terminal 7TM domain-containing protein [Paludibacter sp.]